MQLTEEFISGLNVSQADLLNKIATELNIRVSQAAAVIELTAEGSTVPFISRYRKERTGNLDEVQVRDVVHRHGSLVNLETRRIEVIQAIFGQGKLTDDLFVNINKCSTLTEIEDIYAPYKRKKKTRGMIAVERGLEPLAELIMSGSTAEVEAKAPEFVREDNDNPELSVASAADAIQGAIDIIAERVSQDPENRAIIKKYYLAAGTLKVSGVGDEKKKEGSTYQMYWDYAEQLGTLKAHRVLAINRGEREGELSVTLEVDEDGAAARLQDRYTLHNDYHRTAITESVQRLVSPAVLREIRSDATDSADNHGISVFGENLKNLLMSPPIKGTRVLGIDPGIRTGTKCAAIDETGKFLGYFVINQETKPEEGKKAVARAIQEYKLQLVAIGNGTACQEVAHLVADCISENSLDVKFTLVDEDGASVYSASDVAREEFPELDLTIRGAISIGRRLQDPLAELVKIDPKSIGVGLYQHDVNQKRLGESVDEVVESVVNRVGVNLNTASHSLLKYISGINTSLAKKIIKYRDENGKIMNRDELKKISGMGEKSFEQCAGFLKILESPNPLDRTWVHPENYPLASEVLPILQAGAELSHEQRKALKDKYSVGETTLDDIILELKKPNRDPREDLPKPILQQGVISFNDLREGMKVRGKIKNVVDFGAFVDIGIKESALIHVSEMADHFISDPMELLKVGDMKEFRIISLDPVRKRIGLSLKSESGGQGSSGGRKVVVVKKAGEGGAAAAGSAASGSSSAAASGARPAGGANPYSSRKPSSGYSGGAQRGGGAGGGRSEADDDGTSYNPFADLLKNRK
ncbi:MAG: RNA-binding transcriptional accessory protein [Spirochaetes bacterium]|nr:RNA-binding transcriptional accessory protein [Spirochaetota bacterium]MBU0954567.1 RNA-binding transcriptional accessory protein [Spirochaetota bacterium]